MKKWLALLLCAGMAIPAAAGSSSKPSAAKARAPRAADATPGATELTPAAARTPASVDSRAALPSGTAITMVLDTRISTRTTVAGSRFIGRVTQPVTWRGLTVIPVGASVEGRVAQASEHRRIRGTPTIDLRPETVVMPDGNRYSLSAVVVDTSTRPDVYVDDEGRLKGRGHDGRDWKETGIASGAGAAAGGLIAGGEGALIGAGVGATASLVHWLVKTRSAELPIGTEIVIELSRPMWFGDNRAGE
jgi:hypothetical protein